MGVSREGESNEFATCAVESSAMTLAGVSSADGVNGFVARAGKPRADCASGVDGAGGYVARTGVLQAGGVHDVPGSGGDPALLITMR